MNPQISNLAQLVLNGQSWATTIELHKSDIIVRDNILKHKMFRHLPADSGMRLALQQVYPDMLYEVSDILAQVPDDELLQKCLQSVTSTSEHCLRDKQQEVRRQYPTLPDPMVYWLSLIRDDGMRAGVAYRLGYPAAKQALNPRNALDTTALFRSSSRDPMNDSLDVAQHDEEQDNDSRNPNDATGAEDDEEEGALPVQMSEGPRPNKWAHDAVPEKEYNGSAFEDDNAVPFVTSLATSPQSSREMGSEDGPSTPPLQGDYEETSPTSNPLCGLNSIAFSPIRTLKHKQSRKPLTYPTDSDDGASIEGSLGEDPSDNSDDSSEPDDEPRRNNPESMEEQVGPFSY
ncbi:hypothetical protein OHC33_004926 [Knufia fluminis]|uniref:Uncharacterized protein n=1 Tax=Knufia fluminis TaxID=191047 RepID=A0AAN8EM01_9EURO|nr:hypothetical protein OHC33_004926 [Knufia fluminis]